MGQRNKGKAILLVASGWASVASTMSVGQVADLGLQPAANTFRSYQDASLNRDSGQYQPLDLLNDFYPSIEVSLSRHDNVRRRSSVQEEDTVLSISPTLGYRTNFGRHDFYAAYNGTFTFHDDFEQEDAQENLFNAKLGLDISRRWDLELFGSLGDSFERRGISGSRDFATFERLGVDSQPESVDFVGYGVDLIFGRKIGLLQAVLGYEYSGTSFDADQLVDSENFSDSRDRSSESLHLDVNWQFGDRTSVFGRIQRTDVDYDREDSTLDSDQTNFLIGLRWKPVGAWSGTVGLGATQKDFDDFRREGFDGSVYYANVNYDITQFSSLSFNAARTVEEPGDVESDFYESEFIGLGWRHIFNPRFSLDVYAKAIDDDFNSGREDQFFDWGAELSYSWRNWLTASIYYGDIDRDSNRANIAYEDTYYGIRLRSDLRSLLRGSSKQNREPSSFGKLNRIEAVSE